MRIKKPITTRLMLVAVVILTQVGSRRADAQGTSFSYQGRLTIGTNAASGNWDLQFKLFDAATDGGQIGSTLSINPVPVNSGLFTVTLNFGDGAFNGSARWLEVGARTNGSAFGYTNLYPRAAILPAPYAVHAGNGVPPGCIMPFGGSSIPDGWLPCDGSSMNRSNCARLFAAIGTAWGTTSDTTFNLPDLRGLFLRGVSAGSGNDPDRNARGSSKPGGNSGDAVGSRQSDQLRSHAHNIVKSASTSTGGASEYVRTGFPTTGRDSDFPGLIRETGGSETRPVNAYVNYIIKY